MAKINLIPVSVEELRTLLVIAFQNDTELLEKYTPVTGETFIECIDRCESTIKEMLTGSIYAQSAKQIYRVEWQQIPFFKAVTIGFSVLVINEELPHELFSFGINIKYRKPIILSKWLNALEEKLGKFYWLSLWKRNERAINFFVKNGFTKQAHNSPRSFVILLANHNEYIEFIKKQTPELCQ